VAEPIRKFKIKGMPKDGDYKNMVFGRRMEFNHVLARLGVERFEAFKAGAKSIHLSQKRQSYAKAIREAIDLYNVDQYYCSFYCDENVKDDSFEFWYTTKTPA